MMDLFDGKSEWRAAPGVVLPVHALVFTFTRGSGPGGQNVNKVNTRSTLRISLEVLSQSMPQDAFARLQKQAASRMSEDAIIITASDSRSQLANRRACLKKLRALLVHAMCRPRRRVPTRPTRASREKRLKLKTQVGQRKRERRTNRQPDVE